MVLIKMAHNVISVRPIKPSEWQLYRDTRLYALRDSPDAFASTYEEEALRADESWKARIIAAFSSNNDHALFALDGNEVCGLAWGKLSANTADIFQMWVNPKSRGLGAGRALLDELLAWAKRCRALRVRLGVTAADTPAMHLYKAFGFLLDGDLEPLRKDSVLISQPMVLELRSALP
ncbi:GNAT family N-acetyltransferase [Pseudomonas luteola]|uniref:GNAT family N-acetyltransferase n=1 Tax=Pseudomonas TaxID=286 RepID=UPI003DA04CB8